MHKITTILILSLSLQLLCSTTKGQQTEVSAKEALEYFKNESYQKALPLYEELLKKYNREPKLNYYYGICLIKQRTRNSEAIKRLKFASLKRVNPDVYFYLGKAYQNAYEFEEAIKQLNRFLKVTHKEDPRRETTERYIEDCQSAIKLINKYFHITILSKDTVPTKEILSRYHLSSETGTLSHNRSFFKTGVNPDQIMYQTELENEVLFILEQADSAGYNINKMDKLLDSWSKNQDLGSPINTKYDERYPFMLVDGTTFYFSSNRPGGMGGMDIYQSFFDPETNTFSPPENLGPPFNSPADDYLFAADVFENQAWFSTNRGVIPGKTVVVKLKWDNSVIKNLARDTEQIRQLAQLQLLEGDSALAHDSRQTRSNHKMKKDKDDFIFFINDTLVYKRFEHFQSAKALNEFKTGFDLNIQKDSLEHLMNQKRKTYSQSYNKDELTRLIDEILKLEKRVYGLTDQIQSHYIRARQLEIDKLGELKGRDTSGNTYKNYSTSPTASKTESIEPKNIIFYSEEEFQGPGIETSRMYHKFFTAGEIITLEESDSLYSLANLLTLKAARLLEKGFHTENNENSRSLLDRINKKDSLNSYQEENTNYSLEAKTMKKKALDFYHKALNEKYRIYYPLLSQMATNKSLKDSLGQIRVYYNEATNGLENMYSYNQERYETLGSLKRKAVTMMEQILLRKSHLSLPSLHVNDEPINPSRTQLTNKSEINKTPKDTRSQTATSSTLSPEKIVTSAFKQIDKPIYKIQIGVFGQTPRQSSLEKLPVISTSPIPGKKLTKYFAGNWNSFEKAKEALSSIQEAGFKGAFVVAFLNEQPISINKARAVSPKPPKTE